MSCSRCADWLNVQTYDYRGSRDKIAEHHSPLMAATHAEGRDKDLNQVCTSRVLILVSGQFYEFTRIQASNI